MHYRYSVPFWKQAPFIRLLLPFITGIITEWYLQFPLLPILISSTGFAMTYGLFFLFSAGLRFRLLNIQGLSLNMLLVCLGLAITWNKDIRHSETWYGRLYHSGDLIIIRLDEPLTEKAKSCKASGSVEGIIRNGCLIKCTGKLLMYFSNTTTGPGRDAKILLHYGDMVLIDKTPLPIKNSGNPGSFHYERYAAFQQVFHNVFLKEKDWVKLDQTTVNPLNQFIFAARDNVLYALRKNINSSKDELGLAEALLIGYTNDLDRDLVLAYSNTGVVHIIAISGMHLALIYMLLVSIFKKIPVLNKSGILQLAMVLIFLWLFSLLTGASASVIRAAVMFTFIAIGSGIKKRSSIYNSLAASAFVILCYNPYFLWDVGFQLSYLAVISIVFFQKQVHNWWHIKNKLAAKVWELAAVSLAAQVLTFPVCIYYFHQFPNFFLLTNIIAVPLSTVILYAEIGLLAVSWIPYAGPFAGKIVTWLVWLMNQVIIRINELPFAVWENIPATVLSTWILYALIFAFSAWMIRGDQRFLKAGLFFLLSFLLESIYDKWQYYGQQKIIVYNIPQHRAIDFVDGNKFNFIGDSILSKDAALRNFSLKPTRIALQLYSSKPLSNFYRQGLFYQFKNKKILLIDSTLIFEGRFQKVALDLIIVSKNPKLRIAQLASVFDCRQYVFDASNSLWRIDKWQKECEELHLRSYSVPESGAYIEDIKE